MQTHLAAGLFPLNQWEFYQNVIRKPNPDASLIKLYAAFSMFLRLWVYINQHIFSTFTNLFPSLMICCCYEVCLISGSRAKRETLGSTIRGFDASLACRIWSSLSVELVASPDPTGCMWWGATSRQLYLVSSVHVCSSSNSCMTVFMCRLLHSE